MLYLVCFDFKEPENSAINRHLTLSQFFLLTCEKSVTERMERHSIATFGSLFKGEVSSHSLLNQNMYIKWRKAGRQEASFSVIHILVCGMS